MDIEKDFLLLQYSFVPGAEPWKPVGKAWRGDADAWLVAHDLYHHLPDDTGTWEQEVETLGAEYYCNHEGSNTTEIHEPGEASLARSAASIVGLMWERSSDPLRKLALPDTPAGSLGLRLDSMFERIAHSAGEELRCLVYNDCPEADALLRQGADGWMAFQYAMRRGYLKAKARYPDRERVRAAWKSLMLDLKRLGRNDSVSGACLTLQRKGYDYEVSLEPEFATA